LEEEDRVFPISVDGVHALVQEPRHPVLSKNTAYHSHKSHSAALNYELGILIRKSQLAWISGPSPAGTHDITVFRRGLKDKIPVGKKAIGDNGYRGEGAVMSCPNSHDAALLRELKGRARARHETFNGRLKNFACLDQRFRHGIHKHKMVFIAVCVIVQYQMDNGSPLFDV
jgi:hypothetical protein